MSRGSYKASDKVILDVKQLDDEGNVIRIGSDPATEEENKLDRDFILALNNFGFQHFIIGYHKTGLRTLINKEKNRRWSIDTDRAKPVETTAHDNHLRSDRVVIKDGEKTLTE